MNQWAEQGDKKDDKPKDNTPELTKTTAWAEQPAKEPEPAAEAPKPKAKAKAKAKVKEL